MIHDSKFAYLFVILATINLMYGDGVAMSIPSSDFRGRLPFRHEA